MADTIARALVEGNAAACVNYGVPGIVSIYRWKGELERDYEVQLIIKTTLARVAEVERVIKQHHPHDVPEIIALPIVAGSEPYLTWVRESVR